MKKIISVVIVTLLLIIDYCVLFSFADAFNEPIKEYDIVTVYERELFDGKLWREETEVDVKVNGPRYKDLIGLFLGDEYQKSKVKVEDVKTNIESGRGWKDIDYNYKYWPEWGKESDTYEEIWKIIEVNGVSINDKSGNTSSSSNNSQTRNASNNSSTNTSHSNNVSSNTSNSSNSSTDDEFDVEYSFPEDEFTGPGVDTAQNNNSISNTSTNEMTINGTPTNSYSVSQSNSATYDINVNPNDLLILKYGDVIQHTNDVYRNGKYLDTGYGTLELSSSNPISEFFVGRMCNEQIVMKNVYLKSVVQRFGDGPCDAYYTIKSVNGVPVADLIRQSQALAQSIQAASSQKAINDYTKADAPLVGVNNASQNDDSAILLPSNKSELKDDNHFYLDDNLQKNTWVYYIVYYYHLDENGDVEKNKWVDNRYVGEDGRMYRSRQTPDGLWVGDNGIVVDINLDLYNSTIEKEVTPDSWYCTNAGLWYYFENDRTTTKKGWFTDSSDNQTYYLDPITGIMQVGWVSIDGKYYYFNDQHENEVNWKETGGGFYESLGKKVKAYGSMFKNEETPDGYYVNKNGEYTEKKNTNATGKISWVFVILVILLILIIIIIIFRRLKTKYNKEHSVKFEIRDN